MDIGLDELTDTSLEAGAALSICLFTSVFKRIS